MGGGGENMSISTIIIYMVDCIKAWAKIPRN